MARTYLHNARRRQVLLQQQQQRHQQATAVRLFGGGSGGAGGKTAVPFALVMVSCVLLFFWHGGGALGASVTALPAVVGENVVVSMSSLTLSRQARGNLLGTKQLQRAVADSTTKEDPMEKLLRKREKVEKKIIDAQVKLDRKADAALDKLERRTHEAREAARKKAEDAARRSGNRYDRLQTPTARTPARTLPELVIHPPPSSSPTAAQHRRGSSADGGGGGGSLPRTKGQQDLRAWAETSEQLSRTMDAAVVKGTPNLIKF